jgi:tetratricopeptide (TPR) repeat protein
MNRDGEARQEFERAAGFPTLAGAAPVQRTIARMYLTEANLDAAAGSARRRVALEPNAVEGHKDLGDVYRKQGRNDEALVEFLVATLLDPLDGDAYVAIGQIHLDAGRYDGAVKAMRRALTLKPDHPEANYALGRALIRLGIDEEGKQQLEIAQRLQVERLEAVRRSYQVNLLRIEAARRTAEGAFDEAARLWRQVAEHEPDVAATYVSLGKALMKGGHHAQAVEVFERALQISNEADVHAYLADEYRALGRDQDAARARAAWEELREQRLRARGAAR